MSISLLIVWAWTFILKMTPQSSLSPAHKQPRTAQKTQALSAAIQRATEGEHGPPGRQRSPTLLQGGEGSVGGSAPSTQLRCDTEACPGISPNQREHAA